MRASSLLPLHATSGPHCDFSNSLGLSQDLATDILALIERFNTATDGSMAVPSDYAQIIITKPA